VNLSHTLFRTARRVPRAIAIIERDRIELTYEQLAGRVLRLARGLAGLGVTPGERVAIVAKNCSAYVELLYACWTLGAAAIPVNARLHAKEIAFILDDAAARLCFVTEDAECAAASSRMKAISFACSRAFTGIAAAPSVQQAYSSST
jgi:long-chain acyl-CoA synthetase